MLRSSGLLAALFLLVAGGGCGSSDAPENAATAADSTAAAGDSVQAAASGPKACEVISTADLSTLTGLQLQEGALSNDYGGVSQCRWRRSDGTDTGIAISVREQGDMSIYTSVPGSTPLSNVGEEAVWNAGTHQLAFRLGRRLVSVTFLFPEGREQVAREIAAKILANLSVTAEPPRP